MRIRALFSTIIDLFYDNDLFAGMAALKDNSNLSATPLMAWSRGRNRNGYFSGLVDSKKE